MSAKGIDATFRSFSTSGLALRKSTLAAGLISLTPKPILSSALKLGTDIVWIEAPFSETKKVSVPNATKAELNMGFGVNDIRPAANVDFLKANPKVEKFLNVASIPLADIASQNLKMNEGEKSEKAIKKHAEEWIKANQSTFDSWIK